MRALKITALVLTAFVVLAGAATGLYAWHNLTWFQRSWRSVEEAGYRESAILIDGVRLNYGESPGKEKPPLLLIHGQGTDWRSYVDVLPGLAESFHVFAVDVPGHGGSDRWRSHYSAVEISDLLAGFMDRVIAQPAVVSGHSSGGQIAALVATRHEERVTGLVLEDPPFFTTELPRARQTWNWVDLASNCHHFLESGETDWVAWQWRHQRMWRFFGPAAPWIIESGLNYHARHPHEPIEIWFLPPSVMVLQRTMVTYDPWGSGRPSTTAPGTTGSTMRPPSPQSRNPRCISARHLPTAGTGSSREPSTTRSSAESGDCCPGPGSSRLTPGMTFTVRSPSCSWSRCARCCERDTAADRTVGPGVGPGTARKNPGTGMKKPRQPAKMLVGGGFLGAGDGNRTRTLSLGS